MILRPPYIEAVTPFLDQLLVKILAGVRRCGKSTIVQMLADVTLKYFLLGCGRKMLASALEYIVFLERKQSALFFVYATQFLRPSTEAIQPAIAPQTGRKHF